MNSNAVSEYAVSEKGRRQWAALSLAERSAEEAIPRVSRLTALITLFLLSLGTWALIWAAIASFCGR